MQRRHCNGLLVSQTIVYFHSSFVLWAGSDKQGKLSGTEGQVLKLLSAFPDKLVLEHVFKTWSGLLLRLASVKYHNPSVLILLNQWKEQSVLRDPENTKTASFQTLKPFRFEDREGFHALNI